MKVKIEGTLNDDGTGRADSVYYDDDLEGIVANLAADPTDDTMLTFTLLGATVSAENGRTAFKGEVDPSFGFDTLAEGDHLEVSGEYLGGVLWASYIKKEDSLDDDFEAKGVVSGFNGVDQFTLVLTGGSTLDVTLAGGALIPAAGISDSQYVEVEGTVPDPLSAPTGLLATKVELEDRHDFDDDDDEVEIEGMLSFDGVTWHLRGNELNLAGNIEYQPTDLADAIADGSADGRRVEVRGQNVGGVLLVDRIKIEEDELELKGFVASVEPTDATRTGTVTLSFSPATGTIPVVVDANTLFMNDDSVIPFDLSRLRPGASFVEIKAHLDESGNVVAGVLELEDSVDEYEIEGPLDTNGFAAGVSVSVLGVVFFVDGNTVYPDGIPVDGDIVDIEDQNRDGTAESVDVDD
jgi:hypothetical protein